MQYKELSLYKRAENWILFESGALSKKQGANLCTFLLDLKHTDIKPPLALYQHTIFEKEDIKKLLTTINKEARTLNESKIPDEQLNKIFERYWPDLEKELKKIVDLKTETSEPIRTDREMLEEILEIVREREMTPSQSSVLTSMPLFHSLEHPVGIGKDDTNI